MKFKIIARSICPEIESDKELRTFKNFVHASKFFNANKRNYYKLEIVKWCEDCNNPVDECICYLVDWN
jgi:hypothetical protein